MSDFTYFLLTILVVAFVANNINTEFRIDQINARLNQSEPESSYVCIVDHGSGKDICEGDRVYSKEHCVKVKQTSGNTVYLCGSSVKDMVVCTDADGCACTTHSPSLPENSCVQSHHRYIGDFHLCSRAETCSHWKHTNQSILETVFALIFLVLVVALSTCVMVLIVKDSYSDHTKTMIKLLKNAHPDREEKFSKLFKRTMLKKNDLQVLLMMAERNNATRCIELVKDALE